MRGQFLGFVLEFIWPILKYISNVLKLSMISRPIFFLVYLFGPNIFNILNLFFLWSFMGLVNGLFFCSIILYFNFEFFVFKNFFIILFFLYVATFSATLVSPLFQSILRFIIGFVNPFTETHFIYHLLNFSSAT